MGSHIGSGQCRWHGLATIGSMPVVCPNPPLAAFQTTRVPEGRQAMGHPIGACEGTRWRLVVQDDAQERTADFQTILVVDVAQTAKLIEEEADP